MTVRTRTRVMVVVHSHQHSTALDCSADTIEFQSSKSIKGTGGCSFTLVPRRNYFNYIFPNDVVNIYVDTDDGSGFVRTFMGYVDRINRKEAVNENGAMQTMFNVICTDFSKAVDKTEIYFNPAIANREEFVDNASGQSQLGGHALRTRGIVAHGTPAQLMENFLSLLLGFGEQWNLPRSYPTENFLDKNRSRRRQRAKQRLPEDIRNALTAVFGAAAEGIGLDANIEQLLLEKQLSTSSDIAKLANTPDPTAADSSEDTVAQYSAKQSALSTLMNSLVQLQAYQKLLRETTSRSGASILDVLSLDFIEALATDGFITGQSVWWTSGTLASIMYSWSNECVNELFFDLRPVATDAPDQCFGTRYSKEADELGYNTQGTKEMPASVAGVQYVPAVVFREYPYSVVTGIDLTKYSVFGSSVGFIGFGPVFGQQPNENPGRRVYNYERDGVKALTPEKCIFDRDAKPLKHLDVAVIRSTDVKDSDIGRSDNDIFNLFEMSAAGPTETWKFVLREILPILTPVSIAKHGLRLRSIQTKFANYSRDILCDGANGVDTSWVRRNLMRWALLIDHWYQHNVEYLSGTIVMRGRPDIRVGYRLDWADRHESYYVEQVNHHWQYPQPMSTTLQVSRGQRNDPFPAYIPPILSRSNTLQAVALGVNTVTGQLPNLTDQQLVQFNKNADVVSQGGGDRRSTDSRLDKFFPVRDTRAMASAVGGESKFSGENEVDKSENVSGAAVYPDEIAPNPNLTLTDYALPLAGEDKVT